MGVLLCLTIAATLSAAPTSQAVYAFTTHTFTPCATTGKNGPTTASCRAAYSTSWDESDANFTVSGGIQLWTVPSTGIYRILAKGAKGGNSQVATGGSGASMQGDFSLTAGDVIKILVGQSGTDWTLNSGGGGGGGGSFVTTNANSPLIIAGGGGGASDGNTNGNKSGIGGTTSNSGTSSQDGFGLGGSPSNGGDSGAGANAGQYQWSGSGGGGFASAGGNSTQNAAFVSGSGGSAFTSGGAGGTASTAYGYGGDGGFGGGGAGSWGAPGGGGYSGGGGDRSNGSGSDKEGGGGGGSYNSGTNQTNIGANNASTGSVTISVVITSTTTSIGLAGNATVVYKGTGIVITATVDQPGTVTFFANSKRIASCVNKVAVSTSATCNWRPTSQGTVEIYAQLKPSGGLTGSKSQVITLTVARRSNTRT